MLAEVDNLIVLLQQVALQWLSFSALVLTVLTFQPVCKDPRLLACHRGQGHAAGIPQFRRSAHLEKDKFRRMKNQIQVDTNPRSHDRLDDWQMENLSPKADGGLVIILCFHLETSDITKQTR